MRPHIILTHGRSGSNFLVNVINQHPNLVNYGEVLGEWTMPQRLYRAAAMVGCSREQFIDWMLLSRAPLLLGQSYRALEHMRRGRIVDFKVPAQITSVGIKDFVFLFQRHSLMEFLRDRPSLVVVYLSRSNGLQRYVSLARMAATGVVKNDQTLTGDSAARPFQLTVDTDDLLDKLQTYECELAAGEEMLAGVDPDTLLRIDYDQYFGSAELMAALNARLFQFLGVESIEVEARHQKLNTQPLPQTIVNYDDVAAAVTKAGYGHWLEPTLASS